MPTARRPAWPSTVGVGKPGMSMYEIATASRASSAKAPRPEPSTMASGGREATPRLLSASIASAASCFSPRSALLLLPVVILSFGRIKLPLALDALEGSRAVVAKSQPGAGDQVLDRARREHLARLSQRGD